MNLVNECMNNEWRDESDRTGKVTTAIAFICGRAPLEHQHSQFCLPWLPSISPSARLLVSFSLGFHLVLWKSREPTVLQDTNSRHQERSWIWRQFYSQWQKPNSSVCYMEPVTPCNLRVSCGFDNTISVNGLHRTLWSAKKVLKVSWSTLRFFFLIIV